MPRRRSAVLLASLALAACGRFGLGSWSSDPSDGAPSDAVLEAETSTDADDATDADGPVDGDISVDADAPPGEVEKLTAEAPLLRTFPPGSGSCGQYLIAIPDGWMPTTFVLGGVVYFDVPCKYNDSGTGGWHTAFAWWDGVADEVSWIDGDPDAPGIQESLSKYGLTSEGTDLHNQQTTYLVAGSGTSVYGIGRRYVSGSGYVEVPIVAPSLVALSELHWRVDLPGVHDTARGDGSFLGATDIPRDILHEAGVFYIYNQTINAPVADTRHVTLSTSVDMLSVEYADAPLATGYGRPNVAVDEGGGYHMVVFNDAESRWEHVRGSAPDTWEFAGATPLDLASFRGTDGAWDSMVYDVLPGGQPRLAGVEILGEDLFIFYLAGAFDYEDGPPYDAPRGIGALRVTLP